MKWAGAQQRFRVGERELVVVQRGISDSQLDLHAAEPGLGLPVAPAASRDWLVPVVVLVVMLALATITAIAAALLAR